MFLIEGTDGTAVLYTGDVRAEPWFVNTLTHNPHLSPYVYGYRELRCIYLDTTFAYRGKRDLNSDEKESSGWLEYDLYGDQVNEQRDNHREYVDIMPNHQGIKYLLRCMREYPEKTNFWMSARTSGYEEVLLEVARCYRTKVHVDEYTYKLYSYICKSSRIDSEGIMIKLLMNYLTTDALDTRFHACSDASCRGGYKNTDVYLHSATNLNLEQLQYRNGMLDSPFTVQQAKKFIQTATNVGSKNSNIFRLSRNILYCPEKQNNQIMPVHVMFPYSRHSSYKEARHLVSLFCPKMVYPIVQQRQYFLEGFTIKGAFGDLCKGTTFTADIAWERLLADEREKTEKEIQEKTQGLVQEKRKIEAVSANEEAIATNNSFVFGVGKSHKKNTLRYMPISPVQQSSDSQDNSDVHEFLWHNSQSAGNNVSFGNKDNSSSQFSSRSTDIELSPKRRPHVRTEIVTQAPTFMKSVTDKMLPLWRPLTMIEKTSHNTKPSDDMDPVEDESQTISCCEVDRLSNQLANNPNRWFELSAQLSYKKC
ncbi:hypothetical protein AWJ20_4220 [Sugiyamaella lignohabitans]|uniref:Protein artemis n=1 Tax=Sugiyamaella lignohabitans TaxID=796027 RepID=A0A167C9U4_9ASCO|nr:uncharacterized protein AWJ20_4220 [Sugiyamaella lignohabitans]ANB11410.1 hypothetical protein AWJ20_4220 [Sugiyamaella lignohabitans]